MAKKKANWADPNFNQTQTYNWYLFDFFYTQLQTLAMSRFRWRDLPPKVDARYLEWCLMEYGLATIAWPDNFQAENAFAMQAVLKSAPDANCNYKYWETIAPNGLHWDCQAHKNGVIVWDNPLRKPSNNMLALMAREMCDCMKTKQVIRTHMRQPVIVIGPREMEQQMKSVTAQAGSGNPYIVAFEEFRNIEATTLTIASGREDMEMREMQDDLANTWNLALRYLGINAAPRKMERQTSEEINQSEEPTDLQALGSLMVRRQACDELNQITGGNATVVWNQDVESDSWNALNDMRNFIGDGADTMEESEVNDVEPQ